MGFNDLMCYEGEIMLGSHILVTVYLKKRNLDTDFAHMILNLAPPAKRHPRVMSRDASRRVLRRVFASDLTSAHPHGFF